MAHIMFERIGSVVVCLLLSWALNPAAAFADPPAVASSMPDALCQTAEDCFQAAALPKERLGNGLSRDQLVALKLERLRQVMERFPASLWAKRAGLLSGVLLVERNPAVAIQFLRAAQRDFQVLDDYIRHWIGEALLHIGDAKQAAAFFESIPQAVPDSNLLGRAAFRTGEAWYQAAACPEAAEWFAKAVGLNEKDPAAAQALLRTAACHLRENNIEEGRATLKQLWIRFPQTAEAKEAQTLLASNLGGERWTPEAADLYGRALVYLSLALHIEAVEELRKYLAVAPAPPKRYEARLKMGIAQVRLKQYDQAEETFKSLAEERVHESSEALVWLARVYLRQGRGDKLLDLARSLTNARLSAEQKGQINLFTGIWLEDQAKYDEAVERYRLVVKTGEPASQRAEARWRTGWVFYRTARQREAIETFKAIADGRDSEFEPQALYWLGRSFESDDKDKSREAYLELCRRHPYTYYCQMARERTEIPPLQAPVVAQVWDNGDGTASLEDRLPLAKRTEIEQQEPYRKALELKMLGLDSEAARELAALTERYSREPEVLMALSMMLSEVGAYHHGLRLVRAHFRDKIERNGGAVVPALWNVAYPTGLLPTIKAQGAKSVDPYLVAAIIREESQYDWRAVSRVGAIGLMQVMPGTAAAVARRIGAGGVVREDLFDQETNIRIGVRYVEQLLDQFAGNIVYAVAAYNAGPIAVGKWMTMHAGRSLDEFVELIPYQETRQYVKRVLRSYREYLRLSGSPGGFLDKG